MLSTLEILKAVLPAAAILRDVSLQLVEPGLEFLDPGFQFRSDRWRSVLELLTELIDYLGKVLSASESARDPDLRALWVV